jgi:hypothetical protein
MNVATVSSPKVIAFQLDRLSAAVRSIASVLFVFLLISAAVAQDSSQKPGIGPGNVVVHTALGGFILGYDIDHNGTEGLLAESLALPNGKDDAAIETFDQRTGKIVKIVKQQKNS